jgi:hypothetical protein
MGGEKATTWKEEESKSPLFDREVLVPELSKIVD